MVPHGKNLGILLSCAFRLLIPRWICCVSSYSHAIYKNPMEKDLALRFAHSFATHDCARAESLKKCCTVWEETLICWLKFHLITFYVEKKSKQTSLLSRAMGITSTNGTHRAPCHLEWCWHCLSPGCKTWVFLSCSCWAGGWLAACMNRRGNQEPQKNKLPFGCFSSSQSEKKQSSQTHRCWWKKPYQCLFIISFTLQTLHKQSSRTHAPKIYRARSDTLVDSLSRGRFRIGRKCRSDTYIN